MPRDEVPPSQLIRHAFAACAIFFGVMATFFARGNAQIIAAAAAFGVIWTAWDLIMAWVVNPFLDLVRDVGSEASGAGDTDGRRPTLDETIGFLERNIANPTARHLDIQSALRLEEIYRVAKKEPDKGRRVVEQMLERYPDEAILAQRLRLYGDVEPERR